MESTSKPLTNGGITRHTFGNDDIIIMTGKKGKDFESAGTSEIEETQLYIQSLQAPERLSKYIGLSNQGATCYMNSLLQSLYMTPEFRTFIYSWDYNAKLCGPKDQNIPYNLQRLFSYLQLSRKRSVDTRSLTHSFGWSTAEVFQ